MVRTRILLADDNFEFLDFVERLLGSEYDIVAKVKDGEALVAAALRLDPDVIITDISMPILNGIDAARKLRQSGSRARIVFLTGYLDNDLVSACTEAGGTGFVLKSRMAKDLRPALLEVLQGRTFLSPLAGRAD